MAKRVLDVGNCEFDHAAIRTLVQSVSDAEVVRTHGPEDTLAAISDGSFDLVLINRRLDRGGSDGLTIIKELKRTPDLVDTPVMLVTNYPDYQRAAMAAGAEPGFGKRELDSPETREKMKKFLS
jgi:CheY-like chemotaxis protein